MGSALLKTYAANFNAQISCVGKPAKLSGSCLSTIYEGLDRV